jgi:hypothetical protein
MLTVYELAARYILSMAMALLITGMIRVWYRFMSVRTQFLICSAIYAVLCASVGRILGRSEPWWLVGLILLWVMYPVVRWQVRKHGLGARREAFEQYWLFSAMLQDTENFRTASELRAEAERLCTVEVFDNDFIALLTLQSLARRKYVDSQHEGDVYRYKINAKGKKRHKKLKEDRERRRKLQQ